MYMLSITSVVMVLNFEKMSEQYIFGHYAHKGTTSLQDNVSFKDRVVTTRQLLKHLGALHFLHITRLFTSYYVQVHICGAWGSVVVKALRC